MNHRENQLFAWLLLAALLMLPRIVTAQVATTILNFPSGTNDNASLPAYMETPALTLVGSVLY